EDIPSLDYFHSQQLNVLASFACAHIDNQMSTPKIMTLVQLGSWWTLVHVIFRTQNQEPHTGNAGAWCEEGECWVGDEEKGGWSGGLSPNDGREMHSKKPHAIKHKNLAKIKEHIESFSMKVAHYSSDSMKFMRSELTSQSDHKKTKNRKILKRKSAVKQSRTSRVQGSPFQLRHFYEAQPKCACEKDNRKMSNILPGRSSCRSGQAAGTAPGRGPCRMASALRDANNATRASLDARFLINLLPSASKTSFELTWYTAIRKANNLRDSEYRCELNTRFGSSKCRIMSSSTEQHVFATEPVGEKRVTDLSGIGPVLGQRLTKHGFDKAYVVLGQYLLLKKSKELFIDWLKDLVEANSRQARECYECISEWCDEFL
ncbi:Barrier-to-autointegration factor, partial [Gryllus bimaculatus]